MILINPIYDTSFKFLMEDMDIAKGVISAIIGKDVVEIHFAAQEHAYRKAKDDTITLYRLDFCAKIREADGTLSAVLIEIQKAKISEDVTRFRHYLGKQYQKVDEVKVRDEVIKKSLPIVTIYFLDFTLNDELPTVTHVKRDYFDAISREKISVTPVPFIESLTHDSYIIQIPKITGDHSSKLERVLSVFDQHLVIDQENRRLINYSDEIDDPLLQMMVNQLNKAVADNEIKELIEFEEQIYQETLAALSEMRVEVKNLSDRASQAEADKEKAEAAKIVSDAKKVQAEAEKERAEAEKDKAEAEKEKAEVEKQKAEAEKDKAEAEKEKAEAEKEKAEAEKAKAEADKAKAEAEKEKLRKLLLKHGLTVDEIDS